MVANAILRNQEDAAGLQGPLTGTRPVSEVEKGVGVSSFATALGIPPFLFMREVGDHAYTSADRVLLLILVLFLVLAFCS